MNVQIFELGTYGTPYIMIDGEVYPLYLYASDTFISAAPCDIDGDGNLDILLTYDPLTDSIQAGIAVFNTVSKTIERIFLDGYNDCLFICSASSSGGVQTFEIEAYLDYGPQLVTVYTVVTEDGKEPMILNIDNSNAKGAFYSINETYAESGAMALYREKILQRIAGRSEGKGELIDGGYYDDTDLQIEYDTYFLYDIDSDFVPELIITNSAAETAKTSFIFTVKNGELIRLGAVGASHTTWHSLNGENKLFKSEGHMGASFAQTVEIRDGSLRMGEILYDLRDRDYGAYVDEYCDIPPIYEYRCRDLSGIHWNGDPYGVSRSEIAEGVKGVLNNAP